jgi:hypothetical protein
MATIKKRLASLALAATFASSGCASLFQGTHQSLPITSDPPGATVSVGGETYVTPADASLARDRDYQVVANKPGYQQATSSIHSSISGLAFLDLIFIIPWAVDLADGAAYKLEPTSVSMVLQPAIPEPVVHVQPAVQPATPEPVVVHAQPAVQPTTPEPLVVHVQPAIESNPAPPGR